MISALVTNAESVRLDKVSRKIYKFQTLVFEEGSQVHGTTRFGKSTTSTSEETSAMPNKTGWKCACGEQCRHERETQQNTSQPAKRSKTSESEKECHALILQEKTAKTSDVQSLSKESDLCPSCHHSLFYKPDEAWTSLMEKSKEELVAMVMNLQRTQPTRERKNGHCPTDDEIIHINKLAQGCTEASLQTTTTQRKLSIT